MKNMAYAAVMASFLAFLVVFAFSATPAMAASQDRPSGSTERGYTSPMTGEQGGMYGHMKGEMKGEAKAGAGERGAVSGGQERQTATKGAETTKGGEAMVARVDRADNCLRIRSGPSASDKEIGCAKMGEKLHLTGVFSKDGRWAQLDNGGWVFFSQVKSGLKAPRTAASRGRTVGSWEYPAGAGSYSWGYPSYSYYYGRPYHYYGPGFYGDFYGFHPGFRPFVPAPPAGLRPLP